MAEIFSKDVAEDFERLYESKEHYDTIIMVGEEPNVEKIYAHSIVLYTRSSYFRSALSDKWAERKDGHLVLSKPNIRALIFKIILKFLYCGIVDLINQEDDIILALLVAADELLIQRLIDFIQEFLIKNSFELLFKNPAKMLHFIVHNNQFNELREAYLMTICDYPVLVFNSEEFFHLEEDALKLILKCDNLNLEEGDIWAGLINWGDFQRKILESDMMCEDINNEDINPLQLGEALRELIKFIRFYQIDRKKFIPKVWTYKHLLPDNLIEDILRCYLDPDARPLHETFLIRRGNFEVDSELINKTISRLLMKWIDKKSVDKKIAKGGFQYYFNLLFRSSSDGHSSQKFHKKCDNKGATIVVARISCTKTLIGGYNPLDWNGDNVWKQTTDSFLFRIVLGDNRIKQKVLRINQDDIGFAICCNNDYGPSFGEGPDLHFSDGSNLLKCKAKSYPKILNVGTSTFSEYEVFQVVGSFT
ncbi:35176_t:CDS:2 [Gigaspora margarita]|uniref:35176_t:CDS:1 n=1 Tax=Gigaspora margarita TaxID=4874 RepID=A0ABN7V394_GIGMA|nr:35176_t:CDS:2 [Gigaspora margarita]